MRTRGAIVAILALLPACAETRADPKAISIHPFIGQRGTNFSVTVRGSNLSSAFAVSIGKAPFRVTVKGIEQEREGESAVRNPVRNKEQIDLVKLQIEVPEAAAPGRYPIRLITHNGVSNALPLHIVDVPVVSEPSGLHDTRETAIAISSLPVAYAGRLAQRGETDYYSFHAEAGQTITFQALSGFPQIAAAGSAATIPNFDPALTIYEPSGSWFDPGRLNRIAYNDEPEWVFGKGTDAYLAYRFAKGGDYLLRIEAFAGQGGPDYSYELKIAPGEHPQDGMTGDGVTGDSAGWHERTWTRGLSGQRLSDLEKRGGKDGAEPAIETYRAAPEAVALNIPAIIEGVIGQPGQIDRARFHLNEPADIAIEIETPAAAPPYFNPVLRVLNPAGVEVASNVMAGKGACTGAMTKAIQPKTVLPLRDTGDYTLEIRDATADFGAPDYRYRVLVRPRIPHVGQVSVDADVVNLIQGQAKTIRVMFDREEDYQGIVTVSAESLPPGVSAVAGADFEPEKDRLRVGKPERYTGQAERVVVAVTAVADAPVSDAPQEIRLVVRPLLDGKVGEVLSSKTIPMMVLPKP